MTPHPRWVLAAAVLTALAGGPTRAAPVPAAGGNALAAIPGHAPVVMHVRGIERTKERLTAFLNAAAPDVGPAAAARLDDLFKGGFEGRKLAGLSKDGALFLALLELPTAGGSEPPVALIAAVTSYEAFRDGLLTEDERKNLKKEPGYEQADVNRQETYFLDRQGFVAVTTNKDAAALLAKKPAGLDGKLSPDLAKQFLENDVGLYVNVAAAHKEYGDQVKGYRQLFETFAFAGGADKASIDATKAVLDVTLQAFEDGRAFLACADFRPEGMKLHLQFQVKADTTTDDYLKDQKPAGLETLGTLPAGLMSYSARQMSGRALKSLAPMFYGAMGGEGEVKEKAEAAVKQLIAAGPGASAGGANPPPASVHVELFRDPAGAVAAQLALFRAMGEAESFDNNHIKGKPEIKENDQEYKGFKFHAVHVVWDIDKMADEARGGDAMKATMKKLLGEEFRAWIGTDGKRVVSVAAKDWAAAKARLDVYLGGATPLAADAAYRATRTQLPAETTLLMLADAGPFVNYMGEFALAALKPVANQFAFNLPDELKPVKTKTSYLGFAVTLRPENASFDMFVPVVAVQEMRRVLAPVFQGAAE